MTTSSTHSSSTAGLRAFLETTDDYCEEHRRYKEKLRGRDMEPVCPECQRQKVVERERQHVEHVLKENEKRKTYGALSRQSILSDESLKEARFDRSKVKPGKNEQRQNFSDGYKQSEAYLAGSTENLLLVGRAGAGKSHLAMCILQEVNEKSDPYRTCRFISIDQLLREVKESFDHPEAGLTEREAVDLCTSADLLVLDDLGAEVGLVTSGSQASNFTGRMLTAILNGRQNKPTIYTSNLSIKQLYETYDQRIISRIMRKSKVIEFKETEDQRKYF